MQEEKEFNAVSTSEKEGTNEGGATGSSLHLGSAGGAMPQRSRDPEPDYYFENGFLVFTATTPQKPSSAIPILDTPRQWLPYMACTTK